jgi:hypothetical protein
MTSPLVDRIADAILYEGYLLYPYRASSVKNRQRWTFGGLYPPAYSAAQGGTDAAGMRIECLVRADSRSVLRVKVRFLHLLAVGDQVSRPRQEAVERVVGSPDLLLGELARQSLQLSFAFPASCEQEPLPGTNGAAAGVLVRQQQAVEGVVELSAQSFVEGLCKIAVCIHNRTPMAADDRNRDAALMQAFVSTHAILSVSGGEFVSLLDPPEPWRALAAACVNVGAWPVLAGAEGTKDTMLASPLILYDYPQIAPESPGDLFDGTEIDEILTLRLLTLTDEEKKELRAGDARARALLESTEALDRDHLWQLHGTWRNLRPIAEGATRGIALRPGDRVRLRPLRRADVLDLALAGKTATITSIERDYEDQIYLSVTVDDDPGRDFGVEGKPAHRFFFRPEEVELLGPEGGG